MNVIFWQERGEEESETKMYGDEFVGHFFNISSTNRLQIPNKMAS